MLRVHMGEDLGDIMLDVREVKSLPFIHIKTDGMTEEVIATPEGARALAFMIIGMTDEMKRKGG